MLNRFNGNVVPFAVNSTATNRTVFGDTAQSDDIDDNLNADFKTGWEIVGINDNPTKQDFNALAYTLGNLISYVYQQGIPVWNTNQKFYVNGYCVGSDGEIYRSKTGTQPSPNQGNNPTTDSTNWKWILGDMVDKTTAQTIAGVKTFSSFPITPSSTPTTNYQIANKKYVDDKSVSRITNLVADLDLMRSNGFYYGTDITNAPTTGVYNIIISGNESSTATQIATNRSTNETYIRSYNSTVWTGWLKIESGVGIDQTLQDITSSRANNTIYTNNTGKPIAISVIGQWSAGTSFNVAVYIDGLLYGRTQVEGNNTGYYSGEGEFIVPDGIEYKVIFTNCTLFQWNETR